MTPRVFTPVIMSEMQRKLRGGSGSGGVVFPESVGQTPPAAASLHRPNVSSVRRNLFGAVDHDETRRFVEGELAADQERASERWGFDFLLERERISGPGTKRYTWQKVAPQEKIPVPYAFRGMLYLGKRIATSDNSSPATAALKVMTATSPSSSSSGTAAATVTTKSSKQTIISDFMKSRKRTCSATKSTSLAATRKKAKVSKS